MAEANGTNEYATGNPIVDAAFKRLQARNDARFKDIEDAMAVQGYLERKSSDRLREHAELIARHHEFIARHEISMAEFDDKLNAAIAWLEAFRRDIGEKVDSLADIARIHDRRLNSLEEAK